MLPDVLTGLRDDAEQMPSWLAHHAKGKGFPRKEIFDSRIVYYPGSATDGHPLEVFGKSSAAHCFVYADYGYPEEEIRRQLTDDNHRKHPKGYRLLDLVDLKESHLTPRGWIRHIPPPKPDSDFMNMRPRGGPFALWAVLERKEECGDDHGPKRLSILHVGADGVATFDALFCQPSGQLPYAVLLQDHGFGCNWTHFGGADSPCWQLIMGKGALRPKWLLVAEHTAPWPGYVRVSGPDAGGMHHQNRHLYRLLG